MKLENKVYIVGAGPGAPDLITIRGLKILQNADVILYADSLVSEELIQASKSDAVVLKSAGMNLEEMVDVMVENVQNGKSVARVHTGDPAIYGAIFEQMKQLKKHNVDYEIIPGVSSVFAAAAAAQVELTIPELTQTVILTRAEGRTPMPEKEELRSLASHQSTVCLYLSATLIKKVVREFYEAGWSEDAPVVVVYRASWPDEKVVRTTLSELDRVMREEGIRKQAIVIISKAVDEKLLSEGNYESKLYDKTFTHGYRKGEG